MAAASALYDVEEVARMLGRSPKSIYRLAAAGQIPSRRLGRSVVFPRAWLDKWLAGETVRIDTRKHRTRRRAPASGSVVAGSFDIVAGAGR